MELFLQYVLPCLITGLVGIAVATINARTLHIKTDMEREAEIKQRMEQVDKLQKSFDDLDAKLDGLTEVSRQNYDLLKDCLIDLAKDRINQGYRHFVRQGEIDMRSKESLNALGSSYTALGGNSFIHDELDELNDLPIIKESI